MKIGIVTTWFDRGASYVSRLYRDTLNIENEVFIYVRAGELRAKNDPNWDEKTVWWGKVIESPFAVTVIDRRDFHNWLRRYNIEIVLFNEQSWWPPIRWCNEAEIKTVAYIDYYTEQTLPLFKYYDALICNTKRHLEAFNWHPNAFYVPWGTDITIFKPQITRRLVGGERPIFFHSAGFDPLRKGTDKLLQAFDLLQINPKLIIHSQVDLLKCLPDSKQIISRLVRKGNLEIIIKTVPPPGLYHLGDVYLYPSLLDGIGLTIAESISCGLLPVVTDFPPMNEFINDNFGFKINVERIHSRSDGYYWPKAVIDNNHLSCLVEKLYDNPKIVIDMKSYARSFASEHLSWHNNSKILNSIFKSIKTHNIAKQINWDDLKNFERYGFRKLNRIYIKFHPIMKVLKKLHKRI